MDFGISGSKASPSFWPAHVNRRDKRDPRRPAMYVVGGDSSSYRPWAPIYSLTFDIDDAEVALFTGGSDISPELYGEKNAHSSPWVDRDRREVREFEILIKKKVPMIGICRGAQLITALTGGKLWQHVDGHGNGHHPITTSDGQTYEVTSAHHQMMRPTGNFKIAAWSPRLTDRFLNQEGDKNHKPDFEEGDPEVIIYPDVKALCIQGHPEWMATYNPTNMYFRQLAKEHLL